MKKEKKIFRKKEEILADLKKNKMFTEKMKFARERFYPALCKASSSVEDAQIFLSGFNTALMQSFLALMKEKKMGELDLVNKLAAATPQYKEVVALFDDYSVFDAKDQIEGMKNEISLFLSEEQRERPLSDLKTKWIDQI